MALDEQGWEKASPGPSAHSEIREFLADNPDRAYTPRELADRLQEYHGGSETEQAITALAYELLLQHLVWEDVVDHRVVETAKHLPDEEYYRIAEST